MDKNSYKCILEKEAGIINTGLSYINKHKKAIVGTGIGAGVTGGAYVLGGDKTKKKVKKVGKSIATGYINGGAQDIAKNIGGLAGLGIALKKGSSIGKAVSKGVIPGMAIGDIAGAAIIPTYQLYKKHKQEFGEAPDKKILGKVLATNVLPTVGVWGGIYGTKKALKSGKLNPNISNNKYIEKIKSGAHKIGNIDKKLEGKVGDVSKKINDLKTDFKKLNGNPEMISSVGGKKGVQDIMNKHTKNISKSMLGVGGAFAPIALLQEGAALPTYIATPENLIEAKKNKIRSEYQR